MENKIDIAAILKDCHRGMELDCTIYDGVTLDCVTIESDCHYNGKNDYPIKIVTKNGFSTRLTKYGQNVDIEEAKCVIFPKGKKTWEGFQRFKDGDIVATTNGLWIGITTGGYSGSIIPTYCVIHSDESFEAYLNYKKNWAFARLANKEEKEKLFQVIESNGYKWNAETKTLEKIKLKFKDGDIISDVYFNSICIFKGEGSIRGTVDFYCGISRISNSNKLIIKDAKNSDEHFGEINKYNFATEEEKQKLLQTIERSGYKWDDENKELIKPTFKNGDVLYVDANDKGDDDDRYKYVFIFEELVGCNKEEMVRVGSKVMAHCYMTLDGYFTPRNVYLIDSTYPIRFATEKEKQKLFQVIKANGYRWNPETKTLEKLVEPKFKVGDIITNGKTFIAIGYIDDEYYYEINRDIAHRLCIKNQDEWELVPNKFDVNTLKPFD